MGSVAKRCESVNTLVSLIWWMFGFYWVVAGGNVLLQNAPSLYWYDLEPSCCWLHILLLSKINSVNAFLFRLLVISNMFLLEGKFCQLFAVLPLYC